MLALPPPARCPQAPEVIGLGWRDGRRARPPAAAPLPLRRPAGPWIESYFFEHWLRNGARSAATYLPIFFDPFFFQVQSHKYTPSRFERTQRALKETLAGLDPSKPYFTVLGMYDFPIWDWHAFPCNVVVFSANGGGDLPIPLLPGSISRPAKGERDIAVSFFGSLEGPSDFNQVRSRMHAALKDLAFFGRGPHWRDGMARSTFSLCPRGLGRASFRLYEAMALGSIPIYIWDDREWLPFQDRLDWSEFAISLPIDAMDELPDRLAALSPSTSAPCSAAWWRSCRPTSPWRPPAGRLSSEAIAYAPLPMLRRSPVNGSFLELLTIAIPLC